MKQHIRIHKAEPNMGALNYSHLLDAPAGKHGFVQVKDGHLYFADGTRARFLGFNVATRSNTPDHETADKLAERFASMGVNVIRLHAADAPIGHTPGSWSSCAEAPLIDYSRGDSRHFHPVGLDRFDYFAAKLKEKGIYLHIDLIVARVFLDGDNLDYPGGAPSCIKRHCMYNARLMELQKEYARNLLCHVNPYTGLAYIDDPAVITIQINNEDSAIKSPMGGDDGEQMRPYREEVQKRFNHFLLSKYRSREELKKAWTFDGACALHEDEDPTEGTVYGIQGGFYQTVNDPMGAWDAAEGPARYADFMEFGIQMNRNFYQEMKDYIHSLGCKVPINTSNLIAGAADVYGHTDGDVMENNTYFNHPLLPVQGDTYLTAGPMEYVSTNPLTMQRGMGAMVTTLLSLASVAIVRGKPFMISEWNEYGLHPFHSTAFVQTVAYACLNDWDGLILYNHHTSENWDDQPADEIRNVFDAYNDPAVICQWGFMASMFLKGLVKPADHSADVVYTQNDLKTLPNFHSIPMTLLPYIMGMRNVFLDGGDEYRGDSDVAVNAGFLNGGDLGDARHGVYYAWSNYRDPFRRHADNIRLAAAAEGGEEIAPGVHLSGKNLVFDSIAQVAGSGDYRAFATYLDRALKQWGILPEGTGYVDGKLISDTGELVFDPEHARFSIRTPHCAYFSGAPENVISLTDTISVVSRNERITLALIGEQETPLDGAKALLFTALGTSGMDETSFTPGAQVPGIPVPFTAVNMAGKLYAETLEGSIRVRAKAATLEILNPVGEVIALQEGIPADGGVAFSLDGTIPGVQYRILLEE